MPAVTRSMLNALDSPLTASRTFRRGIPRANNPRQLDGSDRAQYFMGSDGNPALMRFPALIDRSVSGVKIGQYFDIYGTLVRLSGTI